MGAVRMAQEVWCHLFLNLGLTSCLQHDALDLGFIKMAAPFVASPRETKIGSSGPAPLRKKLLVHPSLQRHIKSRHDPGNKYVQDCLQKIPWLDKPISATPSPNYRTGKICYIEIPAIDIAESAQFYQQVFGWHIRQRNDGSTAFDDTIGEVSGTWVLGRPPSNDPGLLVSIMVASAATTIEAIIAAGGEIVQPVNPDEGEVYAL